MPKINPHQSWLALEARLETESDPRVSTLIREVRDHMEFEIKGDLEPLMNTLTAEPVYHFYAQGMVLEGRQAVQDFYSNMIAGGGNQFEVVVENVIADTGRVVTEGKVKQVYTGKELKNMGMAELEGEAVADDDLYLTCLLYTSDAADD